jgi:aspartokinase
MAGVFGKDPNMKKSNHAELERLNLERKRKLAEAAAKFTRKKAVEPASKTATK